ncbi:hypothetical protein [Listeria phage 20422-1]
MPINTINNKTPSFQIGIGELFEFLPRDIFTPKRETRWYTSKLFLAK